MGPQVRHKCAGAEQHAVTNMVKPVLKHIPTDPDAKRTMSKPFTNKLSKIGGYPLTIENSGSKMYASGEGRSIHEIRVRICVSNYERGGIQQ